MTVRHLRASLFACLLLSAALPACSDSDAGEVGGGTAGSGGDTGDGGSGGSGGSDAGNRDGSTGGAGGSGGDAGSAGDTGNRDGGSADVDGGSGGDAGSTGETGSGRSDELLALLPNRFGFGVASFGGTLDWPGDVQARSDVQFDYLYWYQLKDGSTDFLKAKIQRAVDLGAMPVITHYQLLDRGMEAGFTGAEEWDVVIQAVESPTVMRGYWENVEQLMKAADETGQHAIFQTEPDSTSWLRMFHTNDTDDANMGYVAVAASGHPDLANLPDTIAGYAQGLVRMRDLYAPRVFMGLCEFDNRDGNAPERSVTFIQSLGVEFDVLFTHHTVKYSTRDDGWWDAYDDAAQTRFRNWLSTITGATGLRYIHWQAEIGATDYGLMPDYPTEERISPLIEAGSIAVLFDLFSLSGPPHHQPQHGYTASPPVDHPAYNSLDKLEERLDAYFQSPLPLR